MIDIVMTTCDRLPLLQQTLARIWQRTVTPYRLRVIDDASAGGNAEYLQAQYAAGRIVSLHLHRRRVGIAAHLRSLQQITDSDPVVVTDDDILCPKLEPDWLVRGLAAMEQFPALGLLALNNPQCNLDGSRGPKTSLGEVTLCRNVGATFLFVRRAVLAACRPHDGERSAVKRLCLLATAAGWRVGYLTDVYCQHIGAVSARTRHNLSADLALVAPVNPYTLEPADEYKS